MALHGTPAALGLDDDVAAEELREYAPDEESMMNTARRGAA